jgi:diadenosine tetraphosphatase ApaH/serine/threonine PP2A family protein phosphatase
MDLAAQGAPVVQGNHDSYATQPATDDGPRVGQIGLAWTQQQLDPDQRAFLAGLPLTHVDGSVLLVHASADMPGHWHYVENPTLAALSLDAATLPPAGNAQVRYVFGGHVHWQTLYFRGGAGKLMPFAPTPGVPIPVSRHRHWLATVGSVGQPRDGRADAAYALFDDAAQQLTFQRVPYDVAAAAAAIRATPMPALFADRLAQGR